MVRPFPLLGKDEMMIMTMSSPLLEKKELVVMVRLFPCLGQEEMLVMTMSSPLLEKVEVVAMVIPFPLLETGVDGDHDHINLSSGKGRVGGHGVVRTTPSPSQKRKQSFSKRGCVGTWIPHPRF